MVLSGIHTKIIHGGYDVSGTKSAVKQEAIRRGYVDTPSGQMHYRTAGQGKVLLLLHQSSRSSDAYTPIIPLLAPHYRVIALDNPGFGESDPLPEPFTAHDLGQRVVDCLDALNIGRVRVCGIHTGATVAAELAAGWPERVQALIIEGFPYVESEAERRELVGHTEQAVREPNKLLVAKPSEDGYHFLSLWHRATHRYWWGRHSIIREGLPIDDIEFLNKYVMEAVSAWRSIEPTHKAVFLYDADARLPLIKAPTLVLHGTSPYERPVVQRSEKVAALVPNSRVHTIEDADVNLCYFRGKEFAKVLLDFLGKQ